MSATKEQPRPKTHEPTETEHDRAAIEMARRSRRRQRLQVSGWRTLGYVLFFAAWSLASGRLMADYLLPPPHAVLGAIWNNLADGDIFFHFWASLQKIVAGFAISLTLGGTIGFLMRRRFWDRFFRDGIIGALSTPGLVFALTAAMIFGLGPWGPIVAIVLTAMPFVTINIAEGVKTIPKDLIDMARAYDISEANRLRQIIIPHVAPFTFTAVRYGFAISWKVAMLTELFGSSNGIGYQMRLAFLNFKMAEMLSWAVAFFLFALFLEKVALERIEARFFRWRQGVVVA